MAGRGSDKDERGPASRSSIDSEAADQARAELPNRIIESGLFDLDRDATGLVRMRQILAYLPDRTVVEFAERLKAVNGGQAADIGAFVEAHGITPAEQRLLESLVNGETVVGHAEKQGISINTARTHMRRLLEKTGSRGQLDLVRKARGES